MGHNATTTTNNNNKNSPKIMTILNLAMRWHELRDEACIVWTTFVGQSDSSSLGNNSLFFLFVDVLTK
jgi:hypothetical protein